MAVDFQQPPPFPLSTAAGAASHGLVTASGSTDRRSALQPYGGAGEVFSGPERTHQGLPTIPGPLPDSLYQDRPLFGGVLAFNSPWEYTEGEPMRGGFELILGRPSLSMIEGEQQAAQAFEAPATWREAPPVMSICRQVPTT